MFSIKTDIREYQCESHARVETLIRNWVIRPTDLIRERTEGDWEPIGTHPAFVGLFDTLAEQERNTPDTVVSAPPSAPPGVSDGGTADPDEVTRLVGRPLVADSEADDARETDVFDEDEIARSMEEFDAEREAAAAALDVPQAPAGVETPARDEVTMMTERTFQMLSTTDEDDSPAPADEVTVIQAEQSADEVTAVRPDELPPDEVTSIAVREDLVAPEPDPAEPVTEDADTNDIPRAPAPKLGRHDLPEELFATNEISSPEIQEHLQRLDDLADLNPSSVVDEEDAAAPADADETSDWGTLGEDSGVDEAWGVVEESLRTTEEFNAAQHRDGLADPDEPTDEEFDAATRDEQDNGLEEESLGDLDEDNFEEEDEDFEEDELDEEEDEGESPFEEPFISDGYHIPLPYPVRPTEDDIRLGLPSGNVSDAVKDRTYPLPSPRTLDKIYRQTFDLSPAPPRDRTGIIAAGMLFLILVIAISVANC